MYYRERPTELDPEKETLEYILDPQSFPAESPSFAEKAKLPVWERLVTGLKGKPVPMGGGSALLSLLGGAILMLSAFFPFVDGKPGIGLVRFTSFGGIFFYHYSEPVRYALPGNLPSGGEAWIPTGIWPLMLGAAIVLVSWRCARSFNTRAHLEECRFAVIALSAIAFYGLYGYSLGSQGSFISSATTIAFLCGSGLALFGSSLMLTNNEFNEIRWLKPPLP